MRRQRAVTCFALIASLLVAGSAGAKHCQFGYADAVNVGDSVLIGWQPAKTAGVPQDSGRIIPLDGAITEAHQRNIKTYIQAMNQNGIRPWVDITDVVWRADATTNPSCGTQYERGAERNTWAMGRQSFKTNYLVKLDQFLATNAAELGLDSIRGFILHIEINNTCVPESRINTLATEMRNRGYGPGQGYGLGGAYGLTNTDANGVRQVSVGMPTGKYPSGLSHVMAWAYDVQGLWVDSVYNLNRDVAQLGVAGFWNKFVGKLRSGQRVVWAFTAFCGDLQEQMFNGPHLAPQDRLGTLCDTPGQFQATWPIASIANHFRFFAQGQTLVDGLIAVQWSGDFGTNALDPVVRQNHTTAGQEALGCE